MMPDDTPVTVNQVLAVEIAKALAEFKRLGGVSADEAQVSMVEYINLKIMRERIYLLELAADLARCRPPTKDTEGDLPAPEPAPRPN
jgi:hypothetical protein